MGDDSSIDWEESLSLTYNEFSLQFIAFAPQLLGAVALLVIGWILAHALRVITRKLVRSLDSWFQNSAVTDDSSQRKMRRSYALIISKLVFWMVILFFISAATSLLGWDLLSNWMASIGIYIPNIVTGLLIILAGFLLGDILGKGVVSAAASGGLGHATELGRIAQLVIIFAALVIGVETDILFPLHQQQELATGLREVVADVDFAQLPCLKGHDSFLVEMDAFRPVIDRFMAANGA